MIWKLTGPISKYMRTDLPGRHFPQQASRRNENQNPTPFKKEASYWSAQDRTLRPHPYVFSRFSQHTHSEILVTGSIMSLLVTAPSSFINISVMLLGQPNTGYLCAAKHPELCLQPLCVQSTHVLQNKLKQWALGGLWFSYNLHSEPFTMEVSSLEESWLVTVP